MMTMSFPERDVQVPLHFLADYCLRCGTPFVDGQICPIVKGGPSAKYRTIGLCIEEDCLAEPDLDMPVLSIHFQQGDPSFSSLGEWPRYFGPPSPLTGFAKVVMLDNGLAFVGLHRGHVEPWSRRAIRTIGAVHGSYASNYGMVGPPGVFPHQVLEVRFYDLARPLPLTREFPTAENCFIRGRRTV
jgi:hypothetical protein